MISTLWSDEDLSLEFGPFDVPAPQGTVSRWEANDGLELTGYRARGFGYVAVPGVAAYRFDTSGPVVASPDDGNV